MEDKLVGPVTEIVAYKEGKIDTHGCWSGGHYTVPVSSMYWFIFEEELCRGYLKAGSILFGARMITNNQIIAQCLR